MRVCERKVHGGERRHGQELMQEKHTHACKRKSGEKRERERTKGWTDTGRVIEGE